MKFSTAFARATRLPVTFSWSAPLLLLYFVAFALRVESAGDSSARAAAVALYLAVGAAALLAHEWAHAAVASMAGGRPSDVVVNGLGAAVRVAGVPPHQQGAMVAAGPVMTLTVAALAWVGGWAFSFANLQEIGQVARSAAGLAFLLGAFNLLPFGDMDGDLLARLGRKARVARSCAWTMVGLLFASGVVMRLAAGASLAAWWFGFLVALGGVVGALVVGWHGVLNAVGGPRNEWGEIVT